MGEYMGPVWETLPGGHHEASSACLCHFLRCGIGDLHGNPRHHRLRRQHLLLPLHHRLRRLTQGCLQEAESVQCDPDTNGKQTTEDIIIAEAGMSVAVTYQPRTGKTGIKKTVVSEYTAPTTTAAPTTAAPATTGAPSATGGSMTMDGVMDCTCMPNMTAMQADMESMMDMDSMMSATGRAIRYVKKVENGQLRVRPVPVVKDRIIGTILISALRSQIQTAITSAISSAISSALGRSLKPTNKVSKVALRQLFNGGLLGQLAAPATDGGTNIM